MSQDPDFCRAQAAGHQARADAATLPNVRDVELTAAATWLREADFADKVVARRARLSPAFK